MTHTFTHGAIFRFPQGKAYQNMQTVKNTQLKHASIMVCACILSACDNGSNIGIVSMSAINQSLWRQPVLIFMSVTNPTLYVSIVVSFKDVIKEPNHDHRASCVNWIERLTNNDPPFHPLSPL